MYYSAMYDFIAFPRAIELQNMQIENHAYMKDKEQQQVKIGRRRYSKAFETCGWIEIYVINGDKRDR